MKSLFIILFIFLALATDAICCSCDGPGSVAVEHRASDLVIHGIVIGTEQVSIAQTIDTNKLGKLSLDPAISRPDNTFFLFHPLVRAIKLKVLHSYKGARQNEIITVYTPISNASCGYTSFVKGGHFIVYGSRRSFFLGFLIKNYDTFRELEKPGTFWVSDCSRTIEYAKEEIIELDRITR